MVEGVVLRVIRGVGAIKIGMVEEVVVVEGEVVVETGDRVVVAVVVEEVGVRWIPNNDQAVVETIMVLTKGATGREEEAEDGGTATTTTTIDTATTEIATIEIATTEITTTNPTTTRTKDGHEAKFFPLTCANREMETHPPKKKYGELPWKNCSPFVSPILHHPYHGSQRVGPIPVHLR